MRVAVSGTWNHISVPGMRRYIGMFAATTSVRRPFTAPGEGFDAELGEHRERRRWSRP